MSEYSFLLIDENNADLQELEEILNSIGFEDVEFSDNANDAWSLLRIRDFNCVISAWDMSDMSGLALLRIARNDDKLYKMPFFLTSSTFTRVKVVQAGQAGVTGLIVKPFDAKTLKKKLEEIPKLKTESVVSEAESNFEQGMEQIESNNWENALGIFEQLTEKGESPEVYYNIGYIKTAQGEYEKAILAFQKATQLDRLFAKAFEAMGRAFRALGQYDAAQESFQKAADIYIGKEKMQEAEEVLYEILQISPDSVNVFNSLGVLYRKKGDLKTALSQYRKALKVHPKEPHIHYNMGRLYFEMKQFKDAQMNFEKALELDPNFKEAKEVLDAMALGAL
jgi:tetratricopeptide (TPR) repeat protein